MKLDFYFGCVFIRNPKDTWRGPGFDIGVRFYGKHYHGIKKKMRAIKKKRAALKKRGRPEDAICPVCGYYCAGKGGFGCVDKPSMVKGVVKDGDL